MKRLFALVLAAMLVCSTFMISTSAIIIMSPERPSQGEIIPDPDIPEVPGPVEPVDPPVDPPVDIPDEPTPEVPSAPQTGYVMGIGGLAAAAAAAGAVAVAAGKKAFGR